MHREQHKPLFVGRETLLGTMISQVAIEHPLFREAAAFVFIRAHRLDHGLGVGVDVPRLKAKVEKLFNR